MLMAVFVALLGLQAFGAPTDNINNLKVRDISCEESCLNEGVLSPFDCFTMCNRDGERRRRQTGLPTDFTCVQNCQTQVDDFLTLEACLAACQPDDNQIPTPSKEWKDCFFGCLLTGDPFICDRLCGSPTESTPPGTSTPPSTPPSTPAFDICVAQCVEVLGADNDEFCRKIQCALVI